MQETSCSQITLLSKSLFSTRQVTQEAPARRTRWPLSRATRPQSPLPSGPVNPHPRSPQQSRADQPVTPSKRRQPVERRQKEIKGRPLKLQQRSSSATGPPRAVQDTPDPNGEKQQCPKATDHPSSTLSTPHTRDEEGADGPGTSGRRPAPPGMGAGHRRPGYDRRHHNAPPAGEEEALK